MLRTTLLITWKDLRLRLRDRSVFILGLLVPLGLAAIFSLVLGDFGFGDFRPRLLLVDQDQKEISQELRVSLYELDQAEVISVEYVNNPRIAAQRIAAGDAAGALIVPANFTPSARSGEPVTLEVVGNIEQETGVAVVQAIASAFAFEVEAVQLSVAAALSGDTSPPTEDLTESLGREAADQPNPILIVDESAATRELDTRTFFAAGMGVFFVFFAVQFGVLGLVEEKDHGTLSRLLAAPIPRMSVIIGKLLVSYLVGWLSMAVLILTTTWLLGASWGYVWGVVVLVGVAVMAAGGIVALVATYTRTAEQAGNLQAVVAVGLGMLGGVFFPGGLGDGAVATLSYISPHRWFMLGLGDLAGGGGFLVIWLPTVVLLGFALVTTIPAWFRMRRFTISG